MTDDKVLMIDLEDERTSDIADVISNETSKKILGVLVEKEFSESDIASALGLPLNTVGYNIKKLEKAGLIKKSKNFFWSSRGKKIPTYKIYNRKIVISPRRIVNGILPTILITAGIAFVIRIWRVINAKQIVIQQTAGDLADSGIVEKGVASIASGGADSVIEGAGEAFGGVASIGSVAPDAGRIAVESGTGVVTTTAQAFSAWAWFLLGAWLALVVFLLWSYWSESKWREK